MGGGAGLDAGAGGTGDGLQVNLTLEEAGLRQRQKRQLDGGRKASRVGHLRRSGDAVALELRKPIDIAVGLVPEILGQVHDLEPFRARMLLPERAALPVRGTKEKDVDTVQVHDVREYEVRIADEAGMVLRHGLAHLALRMDPGNLRRRMVHQQADQFTGRIAGASDDAYLDHCSPG